MENQKLILISIKNKSYNLKCIAIFIVLAGINHAVYAKIADCPPVDFMGIHYSTHANYVEATNKATTEFLWKNELYLETFTGSFNVFLESDSQLNIACIEDVTSESITVKDSRDRKFYLDRQSGEILYKTKNGVVVTGNDISLPNIYFQEFTGRFGLLAYVLLFIIIVIVIRLLIKFKNKSKV